MGIEYALGNADAQVRAVRVGREVAATVGPGVGFLVVSPVGPPRMWGQIARSVCAEFEAVARAHEPNAAAVQAIGHALERVLVRLRETLVEPKLVLDASVGVLLVAGDRVHFGTSASVRLYRARGAQPERVATSGTAADGLLAGPLVPSSEALQRGDTLVLGSREAFSMRAVGNLAQTLSRQTRPSVGELCESVLEPCRLGGLGAAAVVVRY